MKETTISPRARSALEGASAGVGMERITLAITAFGVCGLAAKLPKFFTDVRVVKSTVLVPGAVPSSIKSASFPLLIRFWVWIMIRTWSFCVTGVSALLLVILVVGGFFACAFPQVLTQ